MDFTNNPEEGTGYNFDETVKNIESLLDTDEGTPEDVDADNGADEVQSADVDEVDELEDQPDEESNNEGDEIDDGEAEEAEAANSTEFSDDQIVTIDGEPITWAELKKQRMLHADYTRKRQQEAAELKEHLSRYQVQQVDMADMRAGVANDIQQLKMRIAKLVDFNELQPPDTTLYEVDPYEYGRKKIEWERKNTAVQELYQAEQLLAQQNSKWEKEQFSLKQAQALEEFSAKHTEFADKQKAPALLGEIGSFLSDQGFSREEIEGIADSRIMDVIYRLYKHEMVAKQVPQVVKQIEKLPKLAMPGTAKSANPVSSDFQKEAQKYKRSGNFNDAVNAISKLL